MEKINKQTDLSIENKRSLSFTRSCLNVLLLMATFDQIFKVITVVLSFFEYIVLFGKK